jgi:hypothetical protein
VPLRTITFALLSLVLASLLAGACSEEANLPPRTEISSIRANLEQSVEMPRGFSAPSACRKIQATSLTPSESYPKEGNVFVNVRFRLRNISDSALFLDQPDFRLLDEKSDVHTPSVQAELTLVCYDETQLFVDHQLGAGDRISVQAVFDIPQTGRSRDLMLQFRDDEPVELPISQ